jgi:uncharacterized protein (DUF488 family)
MELWSVGHSTHSLDELVALLAAHDVTLLADVRRVPRSARHPHFHATVLAEALPVLGVRYQPLPLLAGWRRTRDDSPNRAWRNVSFRGYADYALTEPFATGLRELRDLGAERRTAMMCSEALWWRCHRRIIADHLVAAGDVVFHIGSDGRASQHALSSFARVTDEGAVMYPGDETG